MKEGILQLCLVLILLFALSSAACVAPPAAGNKSAGFWGGGSGSGSAATSSVTQTPAYVTIVTPYGGISQKTAAPTLTTPVPEEWVHIYSIDQNFTYNKTVAVAYTLKNPPLLINFSLIPVNVTRNVTVTKHYGTDQESEEILRFEIYHPSSYFEVTVRDRNTGDILLQDGFSASNSAGKQYSSDPFNRTFRVFHYGDVLVEMNGNWVNANLTLQVLKEGNINSTATAPT